MEGLYGKHNELARRGLFAAIRLNADRMKEQFYYIENRYKIYKKLKLEEDWVMEEIAYHIKRKYAFSVGNQYKMINCLALCLIKVIKNLKPLQQIE